MSGQPTALVTTSVADRVATITLDSPHNRNALSKQLVSELVQALAAADTDDDVTTVLVRSADRVFCSGADLSEAATGSMEDGALAIVALQRQILTLTKPVVVRLAGPVRAGGIGIVAAADIVIASTDSSFAFTEVKLGLAPAIISLTVLPRMTSRSGALTFLTGETFGGNQAAEMGLITTAVAAEELDAKVTETLTGLGSGAHQGLRETKALVNRQLVADLDERGPELAALSARLFGSEAAREAMTAFLSKR